LMGLCSGLKLCRGMRRALRAAIVAEQRQQ
jgi:hypothetical protein